MGPFTLEALFQDHADFILTKLTIAGSCINDKQWASVRGCLSSNYKFSLDKLTFAGVLGADVVVIPAGQPLFRNSSKVLELFVRYDFVNGQDAAIREMLMTTRKLGWSDNFSSSLSQDITHRFAYLTDRNKICGVITLNLPIDSTIIERYKILYKYCVKTNTLDEYLSKLKELSNE